MRKPLIAANWKMNLSLEEGRVLASEISEASRDIRQCEILVAPPFTSIATVREAIAGGSVALGAQTLYWEEHGAYTGEISGGMLKDAGCDYVLVGHSERRQLFQETDRDVNRKVLAAFQHGLKPVICLGETLSERDRGVTFVVIDRQVKGALQNISASQLSELVIAYEPIWAIGTGVTASPEQAQEVHQAIRGQLASLYDAKAADGTRILYGGSVKPDNIDTLMSQADIDGALVGGASLEAESFLRICQFQSS